MRNALLYLIGIAAFSSVMADDVAIVTAESGYILNDEGQMVLAVPMYDTMTATSREGDFIRINADGVTGRIHKGQVHLLGEHWQTESHPKLLGILREIQKAEKTESFKDAEATLKAQMEFTNGFLGEDSQMTFALQAICAAKLMNEGKLDAASDLMREARKRLKNLGWQDELVAAEVFNVSGLIDIERGKLTAAGKKISLAIVPVMANTTL